MRRLLPVLLIPAMALAAPVAPSGPSDPDLELDRTCRGHPSAKALRAALPTRIDELVVQWPRVGRDTSGDCVTVGRVTVVDHAGLLLTVSFRIGDSSGREGFERPDDLPRRTEWGWVPDGALPLRVVIAGSPSTSEDALEGTAGFLAQAEAAEGVAKLVEVR